MTYKYKPPPAPPPTTSRQDLEEEFRRWNQQALEVVISDYDLPMQNPGQTEAEVVFMLRGSKIRVKIDTWGDFRTNLRCCYLNIRDMRLAEARGSLEAMREALAMLPSPRAPHEVLNLSSPYNLSDAERAYRRIAQELHPDKGGDPRRMAEANDAIARIRKEFADGR